MREQLEINYKGIDYDVSVDYKLGHDFDGKFCQINDMLITKMTDGSEVVFEYAEDRVFSSFVIDAILELESEYDEY